MPNGVVEPDLLITDLVEERFGELMLDMEEVETFFTYRPEEIPPNTVCMYFDWEGQADATTGGGTRNTWEWVVEIYIHGYERKDMQRRLKAIILGMQRRLRSDQRLGRAVARPIEVLNRYGPARPITVDGQPGLLKQFRLVGETREAG